MESEPNKIPKIINEGTEVPATLVPAMDGACVPETAINRIRQSVNIDIGASNDNEIMAMLNGK